jgi:hypothetical protein
MKFEVFEKMSPEDAQDCLAGFLDFGSNRGRQLLEGSLPPTVELSFEVSTLRLLLKSLLPLLKIVPRDPDLTVPDFIRQTEDYQKGLFDFDEPTKPVVLAAAYYFGESFIRKFTQLKWATGNIEYLQANMPVVSGFAHNIEMAPILIVENIFTGIIAGSRNETSIDIAIDTWSSSKYL